MEVMDIAWGLLKGSQAIQDLCWTAFSIFYGLLCVFVQI